MKSESEIIKITIRTANKMPFQLTSYLDTQMVSPISINKTCLKPDLAGIAEGPVGKIPRSLIKSSTDQ